MPELAQMSAAGDQQTTIEPTSGVLSSGDSPQTVGGGGGRGDVGMAPSRLTDSAMSEANRLVDAAIANAYTELKQDHGFKANEESGGVIIGQNGVKNIEWMTYEQFTVPLGTDKIREFVETWEYEPSWKYCIDFLEEISTEYDFRYRYQVRWSIPTRRKPIPRATARVFFTIVVSKIRPQHLPCEVYYMFETNSLVHRPGKSRFRQKWLSNIVENQCHVIADVQF